MVDQPYYLKDPIFKNFGDLLHLFVYARKKSVRLYMIDAMPVEQWLDDGQPPGITNNILLDPSVSKHNLISVPDSWCGVYWNFYPLDHHIEPSMKFNCFMNRMDPFRQSWLYQLIRREMFYHGYVSFNMEIERMPWYKDWDPQLAFQHQYQTQLSIFQTEHEFVKDLLPYRNFDDNGDLTGVCYDSMISLVLETYFHNKDVITYSEKTFRALQIPRPWLLFAHKHAVRHLRLMGFDVLDDIVDHDSYDDLDEAVDRQTKILDILCELSHRQINWPRVYQAAHHNQTLLKNFSVTWYQDIKQAIDQAATHA